MEMQTKVYNDKAFEKLDDKESRKNILEDRPERADCDNQEIFESLQLLKRPKIQLQISLIPRTKQVRLR